MTEMKRKVVVVGAGQASATLVEKLRGVGFEGSITVIGDESSLPYQRPPLSKAYLLGTQTPAQLHLRPETFYAHAKVDLRLGCRVVGIDRQAQSIQVQNGDTLPYDELVLAIGSTARHWPLPLGGNLAGVMTLRTLADADQLALAFKTARSVLVIGGGYIGLELASAARSLGLSVTVVEAQERILNRVTGEKTADYFRALHATNDTRIVEATGVRRLIGSDRVEGAELTDGEVIKCDLVIVGIGGVPETSLARDAGLLVDDGIVVDDFCRTNAAHIWAAGDCARVRTLSGTYRLESVGNAIDQAQIVATNIMGPGSAYLPRPWFWTEQYGIRMQIAGVSAGHDSTVLRRTPDGTRLSCWYFKGEDLIAVDAINDAPAYIAGRRLIGSGVRLNPAALNDPAVDLRSLGKVTPPDPSSKLEHSGKETHDR
jgi:3-phenylpropionate/trans-cinnamate dioxygenase ferredoxin reductase subunit